MSYGIKYISTAKGLSSVQWKIELLEKNYSGSTIDVRMVDDGITIGYDRDDDRFNVIYSRYAILNLKVNSQLNLNSLQFDDERKFQVKIYKNNVLEFIGWLIPFYSSQEFEDDKIASISVMAKDGINQLKNKTYVNIKPEVLSKKQSFKDVIIQSLSEVGYSLNTEIYYNKYEDGMNKTSSDCPLSQCFINIESFIDKDGVNINYYDVLYRLLLQHDLRISQVNGVWCITSPIEVIDGSISGRVYNYLGVKTGNKTLSTDLNIHTNGLKVISNSQIRKSIPVQQFTANFEFGSDKNLVLNGELKDIVDYEPNKWNLGPGWVNGEVQEIVGGGIIFKDTYATRPPQIQLKTPIADASLTSDKYLESDEINVAGLDSFMLEAETYFDGDIDALRIRVEMYNEGGTDKSYIDEFGKLTLVPSSIYSYNQEVDSYRLIKIEWENMTKFGFLVDFKYMKIRIYEGIRLRSGTPVGTTVKYRNIRVTGKPQYFNKTFVGKKYQISNSALTSSKKEDEYKIYYKDSNDIYEPQSVYRIYLNDNPDDNISKTSGRWKRTAESTTRTLIESVLVDKLAVTSKFGDIFEGSIYGYVDINKTPALVDSEQRFIVLWSEYKVATNTTEVLLCENITDAISLNTKRFNVFDDDTIVEVDSVSEVGNLINLGEKYNKPVTIEGGITHGILYPDGGIDSLPKDTTNPRAGNKGVLIFGGTNAEEITLGNKENQTLVDVLGGKIKIGYNLFYDKSITDGDGDVVKQLGLDSDFQVDGRIEAVSGISVGSDGILITKELGTGGKPFGQVDAQNELRFVSPVVNVTNVLGVNQITGIGTNPITANAPIYFNQPIYVQPSNNPNSPITNAQFNVALAGGFAVSTTCKLLFNTNQSLAGAKTQGGYTTVTGDNILLNGQTTASENGIYVFDGTNFTRNTANDTSAEIRLKGHLILNGTFASTQWVNNNSTDITVGTTAITYTQWSGAELDPIFTSHAAFNVTNAKIASWDLASTYGTHIGLYVDKSTTQNDIAGAKTFTTSIQSPIVRAGTDALNIQMFNYFGNSPRIASSGNALEFFALQRFDWFTTGNIGQMRLNATGLRIGATTDPLFKLHVSGTTGFDGLISLGKTSDGIAMSSGTAGQFIRRSLVSNGFYNVNVNNWANIFVADISDIATFYQAKITATENYLVKKTATNFGDSQIFDNGTFLAVGGTAAIDSSKFNVIGKIGATTARIGDNTNGINIGNLAISSTGALGYNSTTHAWSIATVEKLNLNATRLALTGNLNVTGDVDITGKFKLNGSFGADHTFLKSNGTTQEFAPMTVGEIADIATYYASKQDAVLYGTFEGERGFKLFHDATKLDTAALFFANQDTGIIGIHYFGLDNSNNVTQHGLHIDGDGFVYHKKLNGSRARFLTTDDSLSGGGTSYSFAEPLYLNGNQVNVRVASASQNGVLTKEDWTKFNTGVLWNGGLVSNNIQLYRPNGDNVELLWGAVYPITSVTSSSYGNLAARITWKSSTPGLYTWNFGNGVNGMVIETAYTGDGMYIGTQGEMKLKANKIFLNGIELNMTKVASQIGV